MTFVELRFEPKKSKGDKDICKRAEIAIRKEFGDLWEFTITNID